MNGVSIAELFDALSLAPSLPGAKCKGHAAVFDAAATVLHGPVNMRRARAEALALCRSCGALDACRRWLDELPADERPRGVVAGRLNGRDMSSLEPARSRAHTTTPSVTQGKPHLMTSGRTSTPQTPLGARLRALRERQGWRQRDLAAVIGTGQNRVGDWESGHHLPTLPVLQRLADAYDTTVSELLDGIRCEQQTSPPNPKGHKMNEENEEYEDGEFHVDNLEQAFEHQRRSRPARDTVKKTPYTGSNDDLAALDGQVVEVVRRELTADGVTEHRTRETFTMFKPDEGLL